MCADVECGLAQFSSREDFCAELCGSGAARSNKEQSVSFSFSGGPTWAEGLCWVRGATVGEALQRRKRRSESGREREGERGRGKRAEREQRMEQIRMKPNGDGVAVQSVSSLNG
jgi:hypothetical protein